MIRLRLLAEQRISLTVYQTVTAALLTSSVEIDLWIAPRAVVILTPMDIIMPVVDNRVHLMADEPYEIETVVVGEKLSTGTYRALARLPCEHDDGALLSNLCNFTVL